MEPNLLNFTVYVQVRSNDGSSAVDYRTMAQIALFNGGEGGVTGRWGDMVAGTTSGLSSIDYRPYGDTGSMAVCILAGLCLAVPYRIGIFFYCQFGKHHFGGLGVYVTGGIPGLGYLVT
jgi:hypothetical protein